MFISYFLKQSLHSYGFTKWPTTGGGCGGGGGKLPLLHYKEHWDKLYKVSYGFGTIMTVESRSKFRNDKTIYTLQYPTITEHFKRKIENCVKGKTQAFKIVVCQEVKTKVSKHPVALY